MQAGESAQDVIAAIVDSPECRSKWADRQFAELLDRQADLLSSREYYLKAGARDAAFVDALSQDLLKRTLDAQGRPFYLDALASGWSRHDIARSVLASDEYLQRRVRLAYDKFLHRTPDLRDKQGLIETVSFYTSTTAGPSTADGVQGSIHETAVQKGELGTRVVQDRLDYFQRSVTGATVYPVATYTVYRNSDGTGAQTTSSSYTWYSGSVQVESVTATYPVVSTAQNDPGTADTETVYLDGYGRPVWYKDTDSYLHYLAYDQATGALVKSITFAYT